MIYGIGETVFDIIFNQQGVPMAAKAGGSVYNALISLARRGAKCAFVGEIGKDQIGRWIVDFLSENGVETAYVAEREERKSGLSIAMIGDNGDASYSFYKDHENDKIDQDVEPDKDDICLIASYYSINPLIHGEVERIVERFKERRALVYYDVNFRKSHLHELDELRERIMWNMRHADVVKGSDEDFELIFGSGDVDSVYDKYIRQMGCLFICTKAANGVDAYLPGGRKVHVDAGRPKIKSTIGAGDNFNAGFLSALVESGGLTERGGDEGFVRLCLERGVEFATEVCESFDNYVGKARG